MSFLGFRRQAAVWLVIAGTGGLAGGLTGCDVLTDAPLTDAEVAVFLTEADSHAAGSRTKAYQATVTAAAGQRSSITETSVLLQVRSDAAVDAAALATRVDAVADELSADESADLRTKRSALNEALQGEDTGAITRAVDDLSRAVAAAESAVVARREVPDYLQEPEAPQESLPADPAGQVQTQEP